MKSTCVWLSRILIVNVVLATLLGFTLLTWGQETQALAGPAQNQNTPARRIGGVPWDWSHHHVIFSYPGTGEEALREGTYDRWLKIINSPRYTMQQWKRSGAGPALPAGLPPAPGEVEPGLDLNSTGEAEAAPEAVTPMAEENSPPSALPRGLVRALVPPRVPPSGLLLVPPRGPVGPTAVPLKNRFQRDWSMTEGNNGSTGLGNYPATYTTTAASCTTDFAVYNTGLAGSSTQASIIAYNHLYSGCSSRPSVYWAYNTGGTIATSVVLDGDGTQAAFVQSNASGVASLVALKWASGGTLSAPTTLTSNSAFPNCMAPCMISITLSGSPGDTYSSPFIAYGALNTIYVGDDAGKLHQFTNLFSSITPSEVTTSPWPVTLNSSTNAALGSPVYDLMSGNIFVGDNLANVNTGCQPGVSTAGGNCGYLYSVDASSGAVVQSAQLDYNLGIFDGPIVDSSAGMVYAFVGDDNSTNCSGGPCAAVFQFPVDFGAGAAGTEATLGPGYEFLMAGDFDNQYYTSSNPSSPSGHLYVVGGTGPQNNTLYAITVTNNVMTAGNATAGPVVATNYTNGFYAAGLPVSEFCNNGNNPCTASQGTDYLFLGVLAFGSSFSSNPCTTPSLSEGCVMGFTAPASGVVLSTATPNGTLPEAGGISGIVVDNGAAGASDIYFSTLLNQTCTTSGGSGGCAIQATQAALH